MPEDEDEGVPGLPPHPLDRVWFHPSELGTDPAPARAAGGPPQWAVVALGVVCGIVATIGVLAATGNLGGDGGAARAPSSFVPVFAQLERDHTADLVSTAGASIVAVHVVGAGDATTDGSGVAMGGDRVLTSADVVAGAVGVSVTTDHGRVLAARVVGSDLDTDLALLRVSDARVPPADTGSTDALAVGSRVLAVGASGGEDRWASQGVVSGLDVLVDRGFGVTMPGLVATDVDTPASAGGGVLLDDEGSVVAILSRVAPGRAVPIESAREVADQLDASGEVHHAWLGVDTVDAAQREGGGAQVQTVAESGPGQRAELQSGDVITELDEARVADVADLMAVVSHRRPGDPVVLTVYRGDRRLHVDATLGERPSP